MNWRIAKEEKLISFLQGVLSGCSGKTLRKILDANCCRINGQVERFGSRRVVRGDLIELSPKWKTIGTKWTFETLYENSSLKIINKPAGWVCDPKNVEQGLFLVHRLDKDTTGALVLAKSRKVQSEFFDRFEKRQIQKSYLALVDGTPKAEEGEIRSLLSKKGSFQGQTIWGSGNRGLTAITRWKRLAVGNRSALIHCEPLTGRTHQIRVHLAEMGHPILVDRQYAKQFQSPAFAPRAMLHASRLQFDGIDVKAPLFPDMSELLFELEIQMGHLRE